MEKNATSLRRIFGLILLFLFFEGVVAGVTALFAQEASVFAACAIMTLLALAVWIVAVVVARTPSRKAASGDSAPAEAPPQRLAPSTSAFAEEIKRLMVEANGRLAGAPGSTVRPQLSTLPLYLVVGLPGGGKTSAVANSGLEPRLLAGEVFRDARIIATAVCNFWFAGGAIFADVSGRVFADEPGNWESLLRLLSGRRALPFWRRLFVTEETRTNLRGVVLVYDTRNFVSTGEQHSADARRVHDRLQAIGSVFRADFPVYTLFAAMDEVPHFAEFFAHLAEAEDRRTMGATLPIAAPQTNREVYAEVAGRTLAQYFNRLCASLAAKRITMLAREDFPSRKPAIYEFPRELKRLRGDLVQFLVDVFRPNPLQRGPKLRGFYFSGVRQASRELALPEIPGGTSLSRQSSDATCFFGPKSRIAASTMTPVAGQTPTVMRWAFLPELFAGVVLSDRAAQDSAAASPISSRPRNIAFAAATAMLLLLCLCWTISWSGNGQLVDKAAAAVTDARDTNGGQLSIEGLRRLDRLRLELADLQTYESGGPPLSLRWGLYSGDRAIAAVRAAYFEHFRRMFLDPFLGSTEAAFAQLQPSTASTGYSNLQTRLKVYRTIAAGACKPDKPLLDRTLSAALPGHAAWSPDAERLASAQIGFYTAELLRANPYRGQIAENEEAVRKAQAYLAGFRGPDRLLRTLLERVNGEHAAVTLASYSPNYHAVLSGPDGIEWAYTKEGRDEVLKKIRERDFAAAGEPCVIGASAAAAGLANLLPGESASSEAVEDLYIREFIQRWKQFLAGYRVMPYHDPQDAAGKLAILSDGNRSPLLALLYMASSNTYTAAPQTETPITSAARPAADRVAERGLDRWFPRLRRGSQAAHDIVKPAAPAAEYATMTDIARAFQPVWAAVDPQNADRFSGPQNAPYMGALAELGDALRALGRDAGAAPDLSLWNAANNSEAKAVAGARQMEANLNRTPEDIDTQVKRLIEEPIEHVHSILPANPGQLVAQPANAAAAKLCRDFDQLRRAYPLNATSATDLSLDAFNRYFAPGTGELAQFVQQPPLAGLLVRQGKVWVQNAAAAQPHLSPQFLQALSAQTQVSEMLYPNGVPQPHLEYAVSLNASGRIPFDFDSGGQNSRFTGFGSTVPLKFSWPDSGAGGAKLTLRTALTVQAVGPGVWGLFRLLSKAQARSGNVFIFSKLGFEGDSQALLDGEGRPVTLQVTVDAGAASAVFDPNFFARLGCSGRAVQ
ncbi:MAG TPA: type VI secretion protein IcmF/TssM N-terminal domain-containing protein [Bryobacteraceae bacterium]|nr:type VI secretion protein IcmF/TssM N-terminal domain-containing protein [Bryobacteraceae bacterium]